MMPAMKRITLLIMMVSAAPVAAQLIAAKTHPVAMGHHHFLVEDMDESFLITGSWEKVAKRIERRK